MHQHREGNGKLKIFLGYAPGVGKTHAMLDAAMRRKDNGASVLVGCLSTRNEPGLEALLQPLTQPGELPAAELDLDDVLARRPDLLVVDDLAHRNPGGYRHAMRYQDVEEVLSSGIDVFTTLDVQQLESLKDIVVEIDKRLSGETVPDRIFQRAVVIEFIDLAPEEIVMRLNNRVQSGEVRANDIAPYLSREKLTTLRELALKRASGIVRSSGYSGRQESIPGKQNAARGSVLVCVSSHPSSERLVRTGKRIADEQQSAWFVLYIETPERVIPIPARRQQLEKTLALAEGLGATVLRQTALEPAGSIAKFSREQQVAHVVIGAPRRRTLWEYITPSLVDRLVSKLGPVELLVIKDQVEAGPFAAGRGAQSGIKPGPYLLALLTMAAATAIGYPLHLVIEPANLVMIYMLAVTACAFYLGRGPAIFASVLGVLLFDYFMVAPRLSFSVYDTQYLLTFMGLLITGLVVSGLAGRVKAQVTASLQREDHTAALYQLSQELARVIDRNSVYQAILQQIERTFVRDSVLWLLEGESVVPVTQANAGKQDNTYETAVRWVIQNMLPAGKGTGTFSDLPSSFYPMATGSRVVGALEVKGVARSVLMDSEKRRLLEAYCSMAALAIERVNLMDGQKNAQLALETERLQNALFNSISHDLRTPLATITGVLSSLHESEMPEPGSVPLDDQTRLELIDSGWEEAERLNRVVGNLLDISRLESGALRLNLVYGDIEGIIGAVLASLRKRLEGILLEVDLQPNLPQVLFDPGLVEQVLHNLVDNALKYGAEGRQLKIAVTVKDGGLLVSVSDRGRGIPKDEMEKIFNKFERGRASLQSPGSGLGLSICRGIIQAHGGNLWVESEPGEGAIFRFTLPGVQQEAEQ